MKQMSESYLFKPDITFTLVVVTVY